MSGRLWCETYTEVVAFGRHLVEEEGFDAALLIAYLEKPWHWTAEYMEWKKGLTH